MGKLGIDFNYLKIENFLKEDILEVLKHYCEMKNRVVDEKHLLNNPKSELTCAELSYYGEPLMDSILLYCQKKVEQNSNRIILPSYSLWRTYTYGSYLLPHIDRPSCEISVTIHLNGDGTDWPFEIEDTSIKTKPGDGIIYLGNKVTHGRKQFLGDFQTQLFLHYVDANGKFKDFEKDKRATLGVVK